MSVERLALPGFYPPDAPKNSIRVFGQPDGSVELVIADRLPQDTKLPEYQVFVSTEYGKEIHLQVKAGTGHVLSRDNGDGTKAHVLKIKPDTIIFIPGTYTVRALVDGKEVYFKYLTVPSHPVDPFARTPPPPPGGTGEQFFHKID